MWNAFSTLSLTLPTPQGSFAWTLPIVPLEIGLWAILSALLGMSFWQLRRLAHVDRVDRAAWTSPPAAMRVPPRPQAVVSMTRAAASTP